MVQVTGEKQWAVSPKNISRNKEYIEKVKLNDSYFLKTQKSILNAKQEGYEENNSTYNSEYNTDHPDYYPEQYSNQESQHSVDNAWCEYYDEVT